MISRDNHTEVKNGLAGPSHIALNRLICILIKTKTFDCTEKFRAYLLLHRTKTSFSSFEDFFYSSKLIVKKKIKFFFGLRPKKIVRLLFTKFPIVLLDGRPKKNCPVRRTFGKIVLLDGRPPGRTCL